MIEESSFHPANLEGGGWTKSLDKKFDLVESLEVAEHLSPCRAYNFVEELTELGDVILFSAAISGQGGVNHVNEQMQSYWAEKFLQFGYVGIDCVRPKIWNNRNVDSWYRQNILIYADSKKLYRYPELQKYHLEHGEDILYDVVHPEIWLNRLIDFHNMTKNFQEYLKKLDQR